MTYDDITYDNWREGRVEVIGWTFTDGEAPEGYSVEQYFDAAGRYLGPDKYGVEPIFSFPPKDER